jgi:hypothetical protein
MDELEPEIRQRHLAARVEALRQGYEASLPAFEAILQPRLEGHLLILQYSIDRLIELHVAVVEQSDVDLEAETRWVALWEVAGRCLSLANLFLAELELGYTAETVGTIRVLNEAMLLLDAIAGDRDGNLVRRWLDGDTVMPRVARPVVGDVQAAAVAELLERGVELQGGDVVELSRTIYGDLSKGAHNTRPGFGDSVSRPLRRFNYGPHPDPRQRAIYIDFASELIEGTLLSVGSALARFFGGEWYRDTIPPLQQELEAVRNALPIDAAERASLGL